MKHKNKKEDISPKSRSASIARALVIQENLLGWLPRALANNENNARKTACIVWYDKISLYLVSVPWLRALVRETNCEIPYDRKEVINNLVLHFDYKQGQAETRMSGRNCL